MNEEDDRGHEGGVKEKRACRWDSEAAMCLQVCGGDSGERRERKRRRRDGD